MRPQIVIQLVLYNNEDFLYGLLKSLETQTFKDFYVLAIDNGDNDESSVVFKKVLPQGELIPNNENLGFAGGHNRLLKRSLEIDAPFLVILNTDVQLHKDFLKHLHACMVRFPEVNACGPLIYEGVASKMTEKVQNYRLYMNFLMGTKKSPDAGRITEPGTQLPAFDNVDYLSGVAMMLRTDIFEEMTLWNEALFLYGEERDFFYRFSQKRHRAMVTRKAVCWHYHDWTSGNTQSLCREYYYLRRNKVLYFRKYGFNLGLFCFLGWEVLKSPVTFIWALRKGNHRIFFCYWLGIWHGILGKSGKNIMFFGHSTSKT
jgi:GT2 family glycosyltransferase